MVFFSQNMTWPRNCDVGVPHNSADLPFWYLHPLPNAFVLRSIRSPRNVVFLLQTFSAFPRHLLFAVYSLVGSMLSLFWTVAVFLLTLLLFFYFYFLRATIYLHKECEQTDSTDRKWLVTEQPVWGRWSKIASVKCSPINMHKTSCLDENLTRFIKTMNSSDN